MWTQFLGHIHADRLIDTASLAINLQTQECDCVPLKSLNKIPLGAFTMATAVTIILLTDFES
jgi:hypothetical protein